MEIANSSPHKKQGGRLESRPPGVKSYSPQDQYSTFFATGSSAGATNYAFETRVGEDLVIRDGLAVIAD